MSTNEPTDTLHGGTTINGAHRYVLGPVTIDTRTNTITVADNVTANDAALAFIARLVDLGWITTPPADMGAEEPTETAMTRTGTRRGATPMQARAVLAAAARVRPADEIVGSSPSKGSGSDTEGMSLESGRPADEDVRDEPMTPGWLRADGGTTWPRPALDEDESLSPSWRATYAPDRFICADLLYLASVAHAYGRLVTTPSAAKQLPAVRRALAEFTVTRKAQP